MKQTCLALTFTLLLGVGLLPVYAAGTFPYNGGFELVSNGVPVGWAVEGPWFVRSEARKTGRNGILLRADYTQAGNRMVSQGYKLARLGETLTVKLSYACPEGQLAVGLLLCDSLGRELVEGPLVALSPAADWTTISFELPIEATDAPPQVAAVKVLLKVLSDGTAARLDEVSVTAGGPVTSGAAPRPPALTATRPNLLQNPTLRPREDSLPGWMPAVGGGFAAESATLLQPAGEGAAGRLLLTGSSYAAAWLSDPVVIDIGVPYDLTCQVDTSSLTSGQCSLLLRVLDPQATDTVWLQRSMPLPLDCELQELNLLLPRLLPDSAAARAQVVLLLEAQAEGCVSVGELALRPQPLSLTVRGVATAGGFRKPSDVSLFVAAVNNTTAALKPRAHLKVFDAEGKDVAYEGRDIVIGSRSAAYFPYKPKLTAPGEYELLVRVIEKGIDLGSTRYQFQVLGDPPPPPVEETP
jgi:hypothetical protein